MRGQLPRHEVVKDEKGPGELPVRVEMGMPLRKGPGIRLPAISIWKSSPSEAFFLCLGNKKYWAFNDN